MGVSVKSTGSACVAGIGSGGCCYAGGRAMASKVGLAGKVAILSLAMPMAMQLMELFERILQ